MLQTVQNRLAKKSDKKVHLARLAEEVIGSLNSGSWGKTNVSAWQKKMRGGRDTE